jgi:hypothetical protein
MRIAKFVLTIWCLSLVTACTIAPQKGNSSISAPISTPTTEPYSSGDPPNSRAMSESLLFRIPKCYGIEVQEKPIIFSWPNIETRINELGDALWGYYSCDQPQAEVVAFYRAHMPDPPYNNQESNWVEREEGSVGVYYNSANAWLYLWVVPQQDDPQKTYVIVAISYILVDC